MKKVLALFLSAVMCLSLLAACGGQPTVTDTAAEETPAVTDTGAVETPAAPDTEPDVTPDPEPEAKQDLSNYLWKVDGAASVEEKVKLELRNYSLIQTMELIFEPASYKEYSKTIASLRSKKNEERLTAALEARAALVQTISVEDGISFIWKDFQSMPIVDGESYTEEELDSASLLGYGYTTVLVKCLIDNPSQAKGNIVMCSGGAMKGRANGSEGYPAVEVFNALGYNCFLLQRRVEPYSNMDIFMDFGRAVRVVRYEAQQAGWGGQDMIAGMGWSGGGFTLMGAVNHFYGDVQFSDYDSDYVPDEIDKISMDLDVAIPVYGGSLAEDCANENLPAFFVVHGTADDTVSPEGATVLYDTVKSIVPAELLLIEGAPHGFGVGTTDDSFPEGCRTWVNGADEFMQANMRHSKGPDFENYTPITTNVAGQDVVFNVLPDGYNTCESEHGMSSVIIHYTTDVYGDTYEKFARVYLPYGYDPDDKETKYNVLYFQHGNAGSPNGFEHDLKSLHAKNLFNNLFDPDHQVMEPVIIVCPTYYLEFDETAYNTPADNPAGDGRYEGIDALYHLEVVEDLIPAVESQFNVYCTDFSLEGIKASRDHRAWTGYSRGSMCTWYMFHENFEYFAYWMPMSAPISVGNTLDSETTLEEAYNYLKAPVEANPDLDFFIFATAGGKSDKAGTNNLADNMHAQIEYILEQGDLFSFGADPAVNNLYFIRSDFSHNHMYVPYSLANAADVLFH